MKRYPIGLQDFEKLREGKFLYVDKTKQLFDLIQSGTYFFLSRPRRFGKSLLLSTTKYLFQGRRDLFEGLWVDQYAEYNWRKHPVLHVSFSSIDYKTLGLRKALERTIDELAAQYEISLTTPSLATRFRELIHRLGSGAQKVVVLIDEYDKPLIDYLEDIPKAQENRELMKNFFSVIKDCDPYIRFFLITGVSKFSKVSLFSDLNHLKDITLHPKHATLTGYTPLELDQYFGEEYAALAEANQINPSNIIAEIQRWYNGYQWEIGKPVYNPFSVLILFDSMRFSNYWWETGTPSFLLNMLNREFQFDFSHVEAGNTLFESYTLENLNWASLMFQTGYLTLSDYDRELDLYTLTYPNHEVRSSMYQHLLATYRHSLATYSQPIYAAIKRAFDAGNIEQVIDQTNILFATIPHQIFQERIEGFFHAILHITFQGLGLLVQSEVSTSKGRVDSIVHSKSGIYVIEYKLDAPAEEALTQIRDKAYGQAFLGDNTPVFAVGISFSSESRTVSEWECRKYEDL